MFTPNTADFIAIPAKPNTLKDTVEMLCRVITEKGDAVLSAQIGEIKGLYAAYELAPSNTLLETIAVKLGLMVECLIGAPAIERPAISGFCFKPAAASRTSAPTGKTETEGWIKDFSDHMRRQGKTEKTIEVYVRAIVRVMNDGINGTPLDFPTMQKEIGNLIADYRSRENTNHNVIAALKRFAAFAKETCRPESLGYRITREDDGIEELLWHDTCTEEEAVAAFESIIREQSAACRAMTNRPKWKKLYLYKGDELLRTES